jgi:hypothetical protein
MRGASFVKKLALILTVVLATMSLVSADEPEQPMKKKPAMHPQPPPQTAPTTPQKGKPQKTNPAEAGWLTVQGRIVTIQPERKAVIIRTDTTDYQVFLTPKSKLSRDGQEVDIKKLEVNDRVQTCHFNAKRAVETLKVISVEKGLNPRPNPERQETPPAAAAPKAAAPAAPASPAPPKPKP